MLVENIVAKGGFLLMNYLNLLANWMHSKSLSIKLLQLESIMKEVLIYWQIECTQSLSFVKVWNNYFHLLANWVHSKSFICQGVPISKNYFHLLVIECTLKSWFVWMFQLVIITYMCIGQLNAFQKFLLWECMNLQ